MGVAGQKIQNANVTLISFDTLAYELAIGSTSVKGGGGTRVQAVEDYAKEKMSSYPDHVFVMTDGHTPPPKLLYPPRWIWILPPWGSTKTIPKGCKSEFFGTDGLLPARRQDKHEPFQVKYKLLKADSLMGLAKSKSTRGRTNRAERSSMQSQDMQASVQKLARR